MLFTTSDCVDEVQFTSMLTISNSSVSFCFLFAFRVNASRTRSELVQSCLLLLIPTFCLSLTLTGLVKMATGSTQTCSFWRSIYNYSLHVVLNLVLAAYILMRTIKDSKTEIYYLVKWLLVFVNVSVLADIHNHTDDLKIFACVQGLGLLLLVATPILLTPFARCDCRAHCTAAKECFVEFLRNFSQFNKWFRALTVMTHTVAIAGAIMALLAIPLPWFSVHFSPEPLLEDVLDIAENFKEALSKAIGELGDVIDLGEPLKAFQNCYVYLGAIAAAFALGNAPGGGTAARAAMVPVRQIRFLYRMAQKAKKYKRQFKQLYQTLGNVTDIAKEVKKPLVVVTTLDNYGLVREAKVEIFLLASFVSKERWFLEVPSVVPMHFCCVSTGDVIDADHSHWTHRSVLGVLASQGARDE